MKTGATCILIAGFAFACSDSGTTNSTGTAATTGGGGQSGSSTSTSATSSGSSTSTVSTSATGSGGATGTGGGGAAGSAGSVPDGGPILDASSDANGGRDGSDAAANGRTPAGSPCVPGMTYGNPLPANPMATMVKSGFTFLEGPVWMASQNALYFSDFTNSAPTGSPGKIHKYTPGTNTFEDWLTMPTTNGLAADERGSFVAASQELRALVRFDPVTKQQTTVMGSDMYNGRPFNCLNDLVIRNDGNIYFSDPNYQLGGRAGQPDTSYFRLSPSGVVTRIGARTQPNGMSLSPDGQYLYVSSAEANGGGVKRHPLAADGSVMGPATDFSPLAADGMAVDCAGNLYLVSGAVTVVSPTGQMIGTIGGLPSGADFVTNAAFGGPQAKTLYITSANTLSQIVLNIPGLPN